MVNLKCYISCFSGSFFSHEQGNFVFRAERDVDQPVASSRLIAAFFWIERRHFNAFPDQVHLKMYKPCVLFWIPKASTLLNSFLVEPVSSRSYDSAHFVRTWIGAISKLKVRSP